MANLLEMTDVLEFEFGMQSDAGGLISVNGGNDDAVTEQTRAHDQVF